MLQVSTGVRQTAIAAARQLESTTATARIAEMKLKARSLTAICILLQCIVYTSYSLNSQQTTEMEDRKCDRNWDGENSTA